MRTILAFLSAVLFGTAAAAQTSGDWTVGLDDSGAPYLFTMNESGNLFGKWCDLEELSCFWMIATADTTCDQNTEYPILGNAASGSFHTSLTCSTATKLNGKTYHRSLLSGPDQLDKLTSQTGRLGFAVPMAAGSFKAIRFSLTGASDAFARFTALSVAASKKQLEKKQRTGTKDVML